jgi:hypothetical protein
MAQSFTDWLEQSRLVVVAVDRAGGHVRVKGADDACTDLACGEGIRVAADDGPGGLDALNPGDIVRVENDGDRASRIVVLRRVWDELSSPEW